MSKRFVKFRDDADRKRFRAALADIVRGSPTPSREGAGFSVAWPSCVRCVSGLLQVTRYSKASCLMVSQLGPRPSRMQLLQRWKIKRVDLPPWRLQVVLAFDAARMCL